MFAQIVYESSKYLFQALGNTTVYFYFSMIMEPRSLCWSKWVFEQSFINKVNSIINLLHLKKLTFQSFDFERTWWRLSQKRIVHTKSTLSLLLCPCYLFYPMKNLIRVGDNKNRLYLSIVHTYQIMCITSIRYLTIYKQPSRPMLNMIIVWFCLSWIKKNGEWHFKWITYNYYPGK